MLGFSIFFVGTVCGDDGEGLVAPAGGVAGMGANGALACCVRAPRFGKEISDGLPPGCMRAAVFEAMGDGVGVLESVLSAAGAGAAATAPVVEPTSISMRSAPTKTLSFAFAKKAVTVPAAGERTSTVTLSVSISATTSSKATLSPTLFASSRMVPSLIESPIEGTGKRWVAIPRR